MTDYDIEQRIKRIRREHTALLEQIALEAVAAWRQAQSGSDTEPETNSSRRGTKGSPANPSLLGQAIRALADVRIIWGLNGAARPAASDEVDLDKPIIGLEF